METQGSQFLGSSSLRIKHGGRGGGERLSSDHFFVFVLCPPTKHIYLAKNGLKQKFDQTKTKALKSEAKLNKSPTRLALIFIHLHMYWLHVCVQWCVCVYSLVYAHVCEVIPDMV